MRIAIANRFIIATHQSHHILCSWSSGNRQSFSGPCSQLQSQIAESVKNVVVLKSEQSLSRNCYVDFGRPLTKKAMSHSQDSPGVKAPLPNKVHFDFKFHKVFVRGLSKVVVFGP